MRSGIGIHTHAVGEIGLATTAMAAPFALGLPGVAVAAGVVIGAVMMGLALTLEAPRTVSLAAHPSLDYGIALAAGILALTVGVLTGSAIATAFLAGLGALHLALTANTRFVAPLGS